eukprot:3322649-Prymnesium_polylepis.1
MLIGIAHRLGTCSHAHTSKFQTQTHPKRNDRRMYRTQIDLTIQFLAPRIPSPLAGTVAPSEIHLPTLPPGARGWPCTATGHHPACSVCIGDGLCGLCSERGRVGDVFSHLQHQAEY